MARRRLITILATTTLAAGLSVAPAWGQGLGDLTSSLEETVDETTGAVEDLVEDTTEVVEDTLEETTDTLTGSSNGDGPTLDTNDLPVLDELDDVPLDVDLQLDVAPQDEDGSLQLEIDGGVNVGDQTVDVGSVTDPIEDVVDPDPAPAPDAGDEGNEGNEGNEGAEDDDESVTGTSSDSVVRDDVWDDARPGGVLEGGAVTAAGTEPRTADTPDSGSSPGQSRSGTALGESFAAFVAGNRGSDWSRGGAGSSLSRSEVPAPRVAGPHDPAFEAFPDAQVEEPDVMATPIASGEPIDPREALLRWVAAAMVLGTAIVFKRRGLGQA